MGSTESVALVGDDDVRMKTTDEVVQVRLQSGVKADDDPCVGCFWKKKEGAWVAVVVVVVVIVVVVVVIVIIIIIIIIIMW